MFRSLFLRALPACLLVLAFSTASNARAQAPNLVVDSVDATMRAEVSGHLPAWARPEEDTGPVAPDLHLDNLGVVLRRSPERQQAFDQWTHDQQDTASPLYHHWLTADEIGERFGASQHDIDAISAWLASQGLAVQGVSRSKLWITFSGTAAQVGAALGTSFHSYGTMPSGKARISISTEPLVPVALRPAISGFMGLSTHELAPQHMQTVVPMSGGKPQFSFNCGGANGCSYIVTPRDFAKIYNVSNTSTSTNGTGQLIAIAGKSRVYTQDITDFQTFTGVTFPQPTVIIPTGGIDPGPAAGPGGTDTGDQDEQTLDVTRAGSIAPGAQTVLVVSASTATMDGVDIASQYAIDQHASLGANVLSISYGSCEAVSSLNYAQQLNTLAQQGAAEGISIFVSSGDSGADGCYSASATPPATPQLTANVLCASGYVTCTGGTEFNDTANASLYWSSSNGAGNASALGYIPEGAWNEPETVNASNQTVMQMAASGGGFSVYIPTPSYQSGNGVPGTQGRYTPDVSFSASAHDGYYSCEAVAGVDCVNSFLISSGTSAAAPDWAGVAALLNQKIGSAQGNLNPRLYGLASGAASATIFHDVTVSTSGVSSCSVATPSMCNNSNAAPTTLTGGLAGYEVKPGYDEATGLGSVDVVQLLSNWASAAVSAATPTVALSVTGSNFTTITPVDFAVAVTGNAGTSTGTVQLLSGTANLGASQTLAAGDATESLYLSAGAATVTAKYSGDLNYAPAVSTGQSVTVAKATLSPVATLSAASITTAQTVNLTATLTVPTGATPPSGNIQFQSNGANLGAPVALFSGVATLSNQAFAPGAYAITAVYTGDANFNSSTSSAATLTVAAFAQDFSLSATPISLASGSSTGNTSTITVTGINGYVGPVALSCTVPSALAETTCSITPSSVTASGAATLTLATTAPHLQMPVGSAANTRPMLFGATGGAAFVAFAFLILLPRRGRPALFSILIFAAASGILIGCSPGGGGSSTPTTPQLATPVVTVAASPNPATTAQNVTLTATVSGSSGTPTGTVQFLSNGANLGAAATINSSGVATLTNAFTVKGTYSITAAYAGNSGYTAATSQASSLAVNYSNTGTPSGSYTVVVTGIATVGGVPVTHTANVAVTVQ